MSLKNLLLWRQILYHFYKKKKGSPPCDSEPMSFGACESSDSERCAGVFETFRLDDDFLVVASFDVSGAKRNKFVRRGDFGNYSRVSFRNIECETRTHVEIAIRLHVVHRTVLLQEVEDRKLFRQTLDDVGKRLRCSHELAPAVPRDVHCVVDVHAAVKAILDKSNVDVRRVEQCLAVGSTIVEPSQIAVRQPIGDLPCHCEAVRMDTGTLDENDLVAMLDVVRSDEPLLRLHEAHRRTGKNNRIRHDNTLKRRSFAATPNATRKVASVLPTFDKITTSFLIVEPVGVTDGEVHCH